MNAFLQAFDPQGDFGKRARQSEQRLAVTDQLAQGDLQGAKDTAMRQGNVQVADDIGARIKAMQAEEREDRMRLSEDVGAVTFAVLRHPDVNRRPQLALEGLVNRGLHPEVARGLVGQVQDWSDQSLQSIAASSLSMTDQLAQMTTGTTELNDSVLGTRTDNISGAANAWTAATADPAFTDVTDRQKADEAARASLEDERLKERELGIMAQNNAWAHERGMIDAQRPERPSVSTSVTFGIDPETGERVPLQATNNGRMVRSQLPDGIVIPSKDQSTSTLRLGPNATTPVRQARPEAKRDKPIAVPLSTEGQVATGPDGRRYVSRGGYLLPLDDG